MKNTSNKRGAEYIIDRIESGELFNEFRRNNFDVLFIPNENLDDVVENSEENEEEGEEEEGEEEEEEMFTDSGSEFSENDIEEGTYEFFYDQYDSDQKLLEESHDYKWADGECKLDKFKCDEKIFLTEEQKILIANMNSVQLFELFFNKELKEYIIESTLENKFELSVDELNAFIGVFITSSFNARKKEPDYWSQDIALRHDLIAAAISSKKYLSIKQHLKFSKSSDKNLEDKIWRVRKLIEIFKNNIQQFNFFSSSLSVDESMIKFYGRCKIKQYMRNKPIRFGLKLWALCSNSGYLFDLDLYCGKQEMQQNDKLGNCNLGTKVVMKMLHQLLSSVSKKNLIQYHVCFDNFFTSPDLLVHLQKLGLKATGTVRTNRVYEMKIVKKGNKTKKVREQVQMTLPKDCGRGTYVVKHDENSKVNYVTVKDTKIVSFLSTAAGALPLELVARYNEVYKKRTKDTPYPQAFDIYNKCMFGVDLHDQHVSDGNMRNTRKKWTWAVFLRIIEASISNASILWNLCVPKENKKTVYDISKDISTFYLQIEAKKKFSSHIIMKTPVLRKCCVCKKRFYTYCFHCKKHYCSECFTIEHDISVHDSMQQIKKRDCSNFQICGTRTQKFCKVCNIYMCDKCFKGLYHKRLKK